MSQYENTFFFRLIGKLSEKKMEVFQFWLGTSQAIIDM